MQRVHLISHRLPIVVQGSGRGVALVPTAGGLASALSSVHAHPESQWFGYPGDLNELDASTRAEVTAQLRSRRIEPIDLPAELVQGYYAGLANGVIWPLFHYLLDRVHLDARADWEGYVVANRRFAEAVAPHVHDDDLVWVHDYQLMLLPAELRRLGVRARIGFFLHIPFPATDVFRILPSRTAVLEGLLGADHIGFHTSAYRRHFATAVSRVLDIDADEERILAADRTGRTTTLGVHPISVDPARFDAAIADPPVASEAAEFRREADHRRILLSVDRFDYTKGIVGRLLAFERLLEADPALAERVRFVQIAVPTREDSPAYIQFVHEVHELVGRINARFSTPMSVPIHMIHAAVPFSRLVALYCAADIMLVTPLRDGMNLVAKEFVVCRPKLDGVLVLSEFAGAAAELAQAVMVNPYDVGSLMEGILAALAMDPHEQRVRMQRMSRVVRGHDVETWCEEFLTALRSTEGPNARAAFSAPQRTDPGSATAALTRDYARTVILLDYDGTLVPLAADPDDCAPDDELLALLASLSRRPHTEVHVVSGRACRDLEKWLGHLLLCLHAEHGHSTRVPGETWQAQTRGAETARLWMPALLEVMHAVTRSTRGAHVEEKTASVAWHYRAVDAELANVRLQQVLDRLAPLVARHELQILRGAKVIEVMPAGTNKGKIVAHLGSLADAAVVALGDDRTDEDLFAALPERAISVHVGVGVSRARFRLAGVPQVRQFLAGMVEAR